MIKSEYLEEGLRGGKKLLGWKIRFWKFVSIGEPDECWNWTGTKSRTGYGQLRIGTIGINRRMYFSHRLSWILHNGPIPEGMLVLHRCDNPPCCNPAHLFVGTAKDNGMDSAGKNRTTFGVRNTQAKLDDEKVKKIRSWYFKGGISCKKLGAKFGVSSGLIHLIIHRRIWRRVE